MNERLFIKITRENLPQIKDRYPFIYLERGRLEVDDSSVKWIDSECNIIRIPCATIQSILLGPGTSVTHEAVKVLAAVNCSLFWVGEDSLLFYAVGQSPTSDSRNFRKQMEIASNPVSAIQVARRLFAKRFPEAEVSIKSINDLMGMEGHRVRQLYETLAQKYNVGWTGRSYKPGKFEISDITNKILTSSNAALYALLSSTIYSLGYSPHIGFIHSGSPLPFVYDMADLYKDHLCIDLAFSLTLQMAGKYNRAQVASEFRSRVIETKFLASISLDIAHILGDIKNARSNRK